MVPIQDILHRIVWDPGFGGGSFVIGYRDRRRERIVRIPFERVVLGEGSRFSFDVVGRDGVARMIPYHRVREVLRDGEVIWRRRVDSEDKAEDARADRP
ncbi:DUF504 domain-containing protein [Massilia putida]|uniref:DUF504 domain-containing protein n=1 Tax=Massilia putida TaxID=1141883 RepID=UPI000953120F|nr:DUF504 domain-containing protein [Massilia putida]